VPGQELADLGPVLAKLVTEHGVPALGCAVLQHGKLVALGASGRRRADREEQVTADDLWHIRSCTPAMTPTPGRPPWGRGKLRSEQTLPELFPQPAGLNDKWRAVTLRHLLDHRAGLPANPDAAVWQMCAQKETPREARATLLTRVAAALPEHEAGRAFAYSN